MSVAGPITRLPADRIERAARMVLAAAARRSAPARDAVPWQVEDRMTLTPDLTRARRRTARRRATPRPDVLARRPVCRRARRGAVDRHPGARARAARPAAPTGVPVAGPPRSSVSGFAARWLRREVQANQALLDEYGVVHRPSVNEEIGASSVMGSQLASTLEARRYDGMVGVWYGKSPGVDRAGDAIRHAQFAGTAPLGGVLALVGDDPACKSSTLPSRSDATLAALGLPVLYPDDAGRDRPLPARGRAVAGVGCGWRSRS